MEAFPLPENWRGPFYSLVSLFPLGKMVLSSAYYIAFFPLIVLSSRGLVFFQWLELFQA